MKNLLKYALIILISAGVFGCSSDNRKNEATEIPEVSVSAEQLAEDAAFQELFQEIDALNMQYFEATADIEPYAIGIPKWLRKVFNVVCADVVGAIACSWAGAAGATIGAIVNSVTVGACLDEEGKFMASETVWPDTFNSYLSSFSYDSNDAAGQIHNETIINTLNKYGKINLQNMSEYELYTAVIQQYVQDGNALPTDYNPQTYYARTLQAINLAKNNDYTTSLNYLALSNPSLTNQCALLQQYLKALENISESNCLQYHIDFRNTVMSSNISTTAKDNIRLCTSVGLGSAYLWKSVE